MKKTTNYEFNLPEVADPADIEKLNENMTLIDQIMSQILLKAHPVGSYYFSDDSEDPGNLFGGTWERIKDKFLLAAGDEYQAGTTGGSADAVIVTHSHTISGTAASAGTHTHTITASSASAGAHEHTINGTAASAGNHTHTITASSASAGSHSHDILINDGGSHTHQLSGTAAANGSHNHSGTTNMPSKALTGWINPLIWEGFKGGGIFSNRAGGTSQNNKKADTGTQFGRHDISIDAQHTHTFATNTAGSHTHTLSGTAALAGSHNHTASVESIEAHTHTITASSASAGMHEHTINGTAESAGNHTHTITASSASAGAHEHNVSGETSSEGAIGAGKNMPPYKTVYCWKRIE